MQFFNILPNLFWVMLLLFVVGAGAFFVKYLKIILVFLLGFSWCLFYEHWVTRWTLSLALENKVITVKGYVASLPQIQEHSERFIFKTDAAKLQLSWYSNYPALKVGDKWQLQVKLKRPHGSMNPGGFNYEQYLLLNHIRATGYVKFGHKINSHWYKYPIDRLRQHLGDRIGQGIIASLVIGSRNGISNTEWQVFRNTGTSHLIAISGLHIGLISGFIFLILNFIWRRIPYLALRLPAVKAAAIGALIGALLYSLLAGLSLPTVRALIMVTVFMLMIILSRNLKPWQAFFIALLIVLIINPLSTLSTGFWLSFAAVGVLIYSFSGRLGKGGLWWKWGRAQFVVVLGLMPLSLLLFQQFTLISFIANIIAIPVVGFVIVPLSLVGSLTGIKWLLIIAEKIMSWLWIYLQWLSSYHFLVWHHAVVNGWVLTAALIGMLLLLAPRGVPARWLGIIWLLPLFFYQPCGPKTGQVWFTLLDVGQGLASVVRTEHHVLIYDTGPKYNDNFDAGSAMVVPFLHHFAINKVDMLVVSHGDNDHIGGAESILSMLQVNHILTSVPDRFSHHNAQYCRAGQTWQWDGITFRFLSPPGNLGLQGNDASCVLKITDGKNSILLTGDIEALTEHILVKNYPKVLKSNILVAPHHGSNSSSTWSFIKAVQPKYVLFPAGYLNRFGFPAVKVIARYNKIHAIMFNTANSGAITCKYNNHDKIGLPSEYRSL